DRFPTATTVIRRIEALLESELPDEAAFRIESAVIETQTPDLVDDYRLKHDASESAQIIADDETRIAPESSAPETPPPIGHTKHFTTVAEDHQSGRYFTHPTETVPTWRNHLQTGLIAVALIVIVVLIFWLPRAPSADALFERIAASVDSGQLDEAGDELDQFLTTYPDDPRIAEVESWKEELSLDRRERRYRLTMHLRQQTDTFDAIEIAYIDALRLIDSAPEDAAAKMRALLAVYGPPDRVDGNAQRCLALAERRLVQLEKQLAESSGKQLSEIAARLAAANQLSADQPDEARRIYQGLIELYGDKPWAWEEIEKTQNALAELPASSPPPMQPTPDAKETPSPQASDAGVKKEKAAAEAKKTPDSAPSAPEKEPPAASTDDSQKSP
ncbi:MAG: hypothetical protein ACIALR_06890, partial [Blastopirellula sp. JB062]